MNGGGCNPAMVSLWTFETAYPPSFPHLAMTSREACADDILDELADHLACAYRRELLRGADAVTAGQRVLERFGDPAALACRLWFDAMKGRIMSQRILVVCCILLTAISLSLAFVMWNQVGSSPEARRGVRSPDGGADAPR